VNPRHGRPFHLAKLAETCLEALAGQRCGDLISVGGAVGLLHYHDYRPTADLDAWWNEKATSHERSEVERIVEETLGRQGETRIRRWGDVVSIELMQSGKKTFSFQLADRLSRLAEPVDLPWVAVKVDAFEDLAASKMVALVERGAPRDFRDVFAICDVDLTNPSNCWRLWRLKQELDRRDSGSTRARLAIESHLERLERLRPLNQIIDSSERVAAQNLRRWFVEVFLNALVD
jgi:hypothetical protein